MKILSVGEFETSFNYFTIVIDKQEKEIFALQNYSCRAEDCQALEILFNLTHLEVAARFSLVNSGTEIDESLIPKKYKKFKIL